MVADKKRMAVAIIGAGAVGLYLAWKLALKGHIVVVYEKKSSIKAKACSGLVSKNIEKYVPGLLSLAENRIEACYIHFPGKTIQLNFKDPHFAICRQEINKYLFELARSTGVSFVWWHPFARIKDQMGQFDRIIGCDGAQSEVRRTIGLKDPPMRQGIQAFVLNEDDSNIAEVWPVKYGFLWRIPRGKRIEYGIIDDKKSAWNNFLSFARKLNIIDQLYGIQGAQIPCGLSLPADSKITLCGDAAGLTKPWSGGGLLWGFYAANILVECFPDFTAYRSKLQRIFLPQIVLGKMASNLINLIGQRASFIFPSLLISKIRYNNDFLPIPPLKFKDQGKLRLPGKLSNPIHLATKIQRR